MEEQDVDEDEMWNGLKEALDGACVQFVKARETEGEKLRDDLTGKLDAMKALVEKIEERSPQILSEYRANLEEKVRELLADTQIEESRIAAEVVIFADKICTDEELVRLKSISTYEGHTPDRRGNRTETGFHCPGDEPGGKYHSFQSK